MATSDITVSGLVATPGTGHIALNYATDDPHKSGAIQYSLDVVEVWAATTNDRALATKVEEGNGSNAIHLGLLAGATYYYWIKPRMRAAGRDGTRYYGEWHPVSATAGVSGAVYSDSESWTPYSPTVTALIGTLGAGAVGLTPCRYKIRGKSCIVFFQVSVPDNGTGITALVISAPFQSGQNGTAVGATKNIVTNVGGTCYIDELSNSIIVRKYDGTYPVVSGDAISGQLEYTLP